MIRQDSAGFVRTRGMQIQLTRTAALPLCPAGNSIPMAKPSYPLADSTDDAEISALLGVRTCISHDLHPSGEYAKYHRPREVL